MGGSDKSDLELEDTTKVDQEEVVVKRKSAIQKDTMSLLRQEQIQDYKRKVTKEDRERRYALRHGESAHKNNQSGSSDGLSSDGEQSPRKKKRVSFGLVSRADEGTGHDNEFVSPRTVSLKDKERLLSGYR